MRLFFPDLDTLHRFTLELDQHQETLTCHQCARCGQLVSHGFVYRKQRNSDKQPVAKRIFCSNRHGKTGCGRTRQLYLDHLIPRLSHTAAHLFVFLSALIAGFSISSAYCKATHTPEPRNAYRWLQRAMRHLTRYRSLLKRPDDAALFVQRSRLLQLLLPTFNQLFSQPAFSHCQQVQAVLQQPFL
ncbi:MAG: hypothetical protein KZQ89_21785 [Candidatus Thiodiazotropha sp. (ex Lucinoma kastoroae)]|nr:hypothetical protein [Candidatus Thiodiazotropha sp. (ex Lucinoma kastoroae)]MCU7862089.1 hypothetical protein [Candidatus Thiodiazotropha sp. (ex Lucinoma kastoroae)]